MYAQISPCLPVKHKTFFGCFLLWTTVDCCGYTLSPSYPQLWYFIPLSFFRLGNLRWPFCLRCFQEIHCNSVRNLRPLHTPPIDILSCFLYNLMFWPPPPSSSSKKTKQTKTKQNKKFTVLYADGNTDRQTLAPSSSFQSWGSQLALYHQSTQFLKYNLSATISVFPSLLDTAATSFRTGTAIISSNDRHHHNLSSLDDNNTGILYLLPKVSLMFI